MAWEYRGKKRYYYQKKRVGKKVISVYVGTGPEAERTAREDELARQKRKDERQARLQREAEIKALDDALSDLINFTKTLLDAHLLLNGYHYHRGEWRKKRNV